MTANIKYFNDTSLDTYRFRLSKELLTVLSRETRAKNEVNTK